jgi:hypothetical protein
MTDGWQEETEEKTVTVTISEDSSVSRQDVIDAVSELFEDSSNDGDNDVTTDSGKRRFERGYTGGGN